MFDFARTTANIAETPAIQGGAATNTEGEQGNQGRKNRDPTVWRRCRNL
jgi:hypothetical protein